MNVSLTPELEKFVDGKVESGLYNNASEVIREGLRLLKEHDEIRMKWREQIERGWLQARPAGRRRTEGDERRSHPPEERVQEARVNSRYQLHAQAQGNLDEIG